MSDIRGEFSFNSETCRIRHEFSDERIKRLEDTLPRIFDKLDKFSQRPSWIVLSIMSFLSAGIGIAITVILSSHK